MGDVIQVKAGRENRRSQPLVRHHRASRLGTTWDALMVAKKSGEVRHCGYGVPRSHKSLIAVAPTVGAHARRGNRIMRVIPVDASRLKVLVVGEPTAQTRDGKAVLDRTTDQPLF